MMTIGKLVRLARQRFSAQHQLMVAIMGWPLLFYLKQGQGVFQWSLLLQYAILVCLFFLASHQEGWNVLRSGHSKQIWILFWCFVLYVTLITLVNSPIFLNGIVGYVKHVQFVPLLLVCSAIGLRPDLLRRWFIPYVLVLIILLALPLALSATSVSFFSRQSLYVGPGLYRPGSYVRYKFAFGNPNNLASFLACAMTFCFFSLTSQFRRARVAIPVLGILLLGSYLVLMTSSRRVWVILPLVSVLGIALQRGLKRRAWLLFGIGLLFMLVLYLFRGPIAKRLSNLLLFSDAGFRKTGPLHMRLILFEWVLGYFEGPIQWLFGLGAGTIGFAVRNYADAGYGTVDGYYAILWGEYGLIGLLLYLALVLTVLSRLLGVILRRTLAPDHEDIVIACLVSSLVVLLAGLLGNSNTTFPLTLYLWAFLGLGLALSLEPETATFVGSESATATERGTAMPREPETTTPAESEAVAA